MIGHAWRTDGFWILLWLRIWFYLISGHRQSWPPRGFVGKASLSSLDTGHPVCRLLSTRMRREVSTHTNPLWRLTCVWRISLRISPKLKRGSGLGSAGSSWATDGAGGSIRRT